MKIYLTGELEERSLTRAMARNGDGEDHVEELLNYALPLEEDYEARQPPERSPEPV